MQSPNSTGSQGSSGNVTVVSATEWQPAHARETALLRGLQIPSKTSYVTSGFPFPQTLELAGVSKDEWSRFTEEITSHAKMSSSQWVTAIGSGLGIGLVGGVVIAWLGIIPAAIVGHNIRKKREKENLRTADESGALAQCVRRWNESYFQARGLAIRIDLPGDATDIDMDIARKKDTSFGGAESAHRKASKRGRIVVMPLQAGLDANASQTLGFPLSEASTEVSRDEVSVFTEDEPLVKGKGKGQGRGFYPNEPKP